MIEFLPIDKRAVREGLICQCNRQFRQYNFGVPSNRGFLQDLKYASYTRIFVFYNHKPMYPRSHEGAFRPKTTKRWINKTTKITAHCFHNIVISWKIFWYRVATPGRCGGKATFKIATKKYAMPNRCKTPNNLQSANVAPHAVFRNKPRRKRMIERCKIYF